jgi:hypothetical protein
VAQTSGLQLGWCGNVEDGEGEIQGGFTEEVRSELKIGKCLNTDLW